MNRVVKSSAKSSLNIRSSSVFSRILRRGVSTQDLDATKGGTYRERVVILGSGWSGFVLSRQLDKKRFQPVVVSPRSYFAFTPLLASTAVGTLEFRTTLESVRARRSGVEFFQGWADDVNFNEKKLIIEEAAWRPSIPSESNVVSAEDGTSLTFKKKKGQLFDLTYDKLVVAVGCYSQTFGTPGVRENAFFLKDVTDAIKIRKRILECFETAALPTTSPKLRDSILNFAVVGGGPTGIEFAAELFDLCKEDLRKVYPALIPHVQITIYDVAPKILPMFDSKLADYALNLFRRDGIKIKTEHQIESLQRGLADSPANDGGCFTLKTKQAGDVGVGMCVWSTGLMMNPFIQRALDDVHTYPASSAALSGPPSEDPTSKKWSLKRSPRNGGLMVDDHFHVKLVLRNGNGTAEPSLPTDTPKATPEAVMHDVFALGDVSVLEVGQLPATAQVASQEAKWLGKHLNRGGRPDAPGFKYTDLGVMTYVGNMKAIMQGKGGTEIKGRTAWLIWRGAYLTKSMSWRNKLLIPMYWAINWCFGRDISRF
ncbi:pyridine nucleotide-disulfide oxidoreductase-domain-containing protein [Amylocarpus encephaloides]|uniref:Pyridine nucleotide-disulfide oxidoreductase-domain-containing protein n=1 Tax=Amylocarpus encephaloides TaxID=45428 RepID=A0A9P7YR92_9HELO|nr:pyridine nucleotide-disulfide oxidoreductase-domain-containing protein [Amylocarpus encephaloides]